MREANCFLVVCSRGFLKSDLAISQTFIDGCAFSRQVRAEFSRTVFFGRLFRTDGHSFFFLRRIIVVSCRDSKSGVELV